MSSGLALLALFGQSSLAELAAAGFAEVTVQLTHEVADQMHGAIVKAVKPQAAVVASHP